MILNKQEIIKRIVDRFLQWRLPENFQPDAGISFTPDFNVGTSWPSKHNPTGTNLFDATQATAMVEAIAGEELNSLRAQLAEQKTKNERLREVLKMIKDETDSSIIWDFANNAIENDY